MSPAAWRGRRILVELPRIEGDAIVFWAGRRVGEILAPAGELDLTELAGPGQKAELRIYLTRNYTGISRGFERDYMRYGARGPLGRKLPVEAWPFGITGTVNLNSRATPAAVTDVFVQTSWRKKELGLAVEVETVKAVQDLVVAAEILDAAGRPVLNLSAVPRAVEPGRTSIELRSSWTDPIPWELGQAYLYTARVSLNQAGKSLDTSGDITFGFREIWTDKQRLMLNGHPIRFRLYLCSGVTPENFAMFKDLGYNAYEISPNPTAWYCNWPTAWPLPGERLLDLFDREGCAVLMQAPVVLHLNQLLLKNADAVADYNRDLQLWLRRLRNRTSIFAWLPSMNYVGSFGNIHADGMGIAGADPENTPARVVKKGCALIKQVDPTRLAFGHAEGTIGDVSSSNMYLNFVPLQEREEWPSEHAARGTHPFSALEFGQPFTQCYWKGPRFLLTEYASIYLGDRAYVLEGEGGLKRVVDYGRLNTQDLFYKWYEINTEELPAFWKLQQLFIRNTDRAWRAWGVAGGWFYWDFDVSFGFPPAFDSHRQLRSYKSPYASEFVPEKLAGRPAWAGPNYDIHRETNQPLLAYLAGAPGHTDKTHAFYGGERVRKQIAWVWDGPGSRRLRAAWRAVTVEFGESLADGSAEVELAPGEIKSCPVEFAAPAVRVRTAAKIKLTVADNGRVVASDEFAFEIFPPAEPVAVQGRLALWDPRQKSGEWLRRLGVEAEAWTPAQGLAGIDLLVLGREALSGADKLPYTATDIAGGLNVLVLEQMPEVWEKLGLKAIETMPRYVFPAGEKALLAGLEPEDLINWRGSPDLLPEKKRYRSHDYYHAFKWTNTHALASVALESPQTVAFRPLLACEFDLNYTPLLEWRHGRGRVYASSLDFTGRVGEDPAATRLAGNLLQLAARKTDAAPQAARYVGGPAGRKLLNELQAGLTEEAAAKLVVAGLEASTRECRQLAESGATVIVLAQPEAWLKELGYAVEARTVFKGEPADEAWLAGMGPRLWRWRDGLKVAAFAAAGQPDGCTVLAGGLILVRPVGGGKLVHLQLDPVELAERYPAGDDRRAAVWPSVERLHQLLAGWLDGLGVAGSAAQADRFGRLKAGATYENLKTWHVCGPFLYPDLGGPEMTRLATPAEADAIAGNAGPDIRYFLDDKRTLDWRSTVTADGEGFVNLGAALKVDQRAVAYVTRQVERQTAQRARLRLGMDFYLQAWVNGKLVFDASQGGGMAPRANTHQVDVDLRAGINVITLKISAGSKGFGFYANLSADGAQVVEDPVAAEAEARLYPVADRTWDPYTFYYY